MIAGKEIINGVLGSFTGRDGEPGSDQERYILKAMWLMTLAEFESKVKSISEEFIDRLKQKGINEIHVCTLIRNFHGEKQDELTLSKILSFYKKNPTEIEYRNFTQDRVPKYKSQAVEKLFNHLGIFFDEAERTQISILNGLSSTRDSIAHGDFEVQITKHELSSKIDELEELLRMLKQKTVQH